MTRLKEPFMKEAKFRQGTRTDILATLPKSDEDHVHVNKILAKKAGIGELYKIKNGGDYKTFEAYCKGAWDLSRPRAYQLIDAAEIKQNLSTNVDILPKTESQTRPLAKLKPDQQREAWEKAVETAPEGSGTHRRAGHGRHPS